MRLRGTFSLDPQATCSILAHYSSTIMMMWSSGQSFPLSRWLLLPTVLSGWGGWTSCFLLYLTSLLRSLSFQRHQRGQYSALFCRRYVATRRYPCIEEKESRRSWGRPSSLRIPLGRRQTDFLGDFRDGQRHLQHFI